MGMPETLNRAKLMWGAYAMVAGGKTFDGKPLPDWDGLGGERQQCWLSAASVIDSATIARICHEVNRAYCASLGDDSQPAWEDAPQWQRDSALAGVVMHMSNPDATPEDSHRSWMAQKEAEGWKYGPVKDVEKKEHHCMIPYAQLPAAQRAKDYLFRGVVHAMMSL